MEEFITNYLEKNYVFSLSTMISYKLLDKFDNSEVGLRIVMKTLQNLFNIDEDTLYPIWEKWSEKKAIELNNKITDFRYKIYEATGYNVELTIEDMNKLLYGQPDDMFDSTLYDYSTPKSAVSAETNRSGKRCE